MDSAMLQGLITSKTRIKLLTLFFTRPDERFYGRELERLLGEQPRSVHVELQRLEAAGLLTSQSEGRVKYYAANRACPIYPEVRSLILKTTGLGDTLREKLHSLGGVEQAFVFGSSAHGDERAGSDIDLMIVGEPDGGELSKVIAKIERGLGRPVNYLVFSRREIAAKLRAKEGFAVNVFTGPKLMLIGAEDDLPKP
jgi:predicted nucleotidyltransferase